MFERFNTIGIKLVATVGAALVVILTASFLFILNRRYKLEQEDFIQELSTITSYAASVREYLAENRAVFQHQDGVYLEKDTVPIIAAWKTAQRHSQGKGYRFRTPAVSRAFVEVS